MKEMNIDVTNHMATLEPEVVEKLDHTYSQKNERPERPHASAPKEKRPTTVKPKSYVDDFDDEDEEVVKAKVPKKKAANKKKEGKNTICNCSNKKRKFSINIRRKTKEK